MLSPNSHQLFALLLEKEKLCWGTVINRKLQTY